MIRTGTRDRIPLALPILCAVLLSLLFAVLYGATNWYTSTRADVGVVRFEWEAIIPFVPVFVFPYMSIDLLFFFGPFLCTTRAELLVHAKRIITITVVATGCFMLFPLKLGIERPETSGVAGSLYGILKAFDYPHNMCPSLHVAYTLTLRLLYTRHTRGWLRWALHGWFALVTMSVLLVYQHHVIDLAGGAALATAVLYAIPSPERARSLPARGAVRSNRRIAGFYAAAGVVCVIAGSLAAPFGLLLLWPALSLAVMCAAYLGVGPRVHRKMNGRVGLAARAVLGPFLSGLWVARRYYGVREGNEPAGCEVVPRLMVGRRCTTREARELIGQGVSAVIDMTAEHSETPVFRRLTYHNVQVLDLTPPTFERLREAVDLVGDGMRSGTVYVHCGLGYGRSAIVVAAVLLRQARAASVEEACGMVRRARPRVVFNEDAGLLLQEFMDRAVTPGQGQPSVQATP